MTASSDIRITDPRYLDAGGRVVSPFTVTGTHDGPLGTLPATGRAVRAGAVRAVALRLAGRVVGGDLYYDQLSLLTQLGLMPQPSHA